MTAGEVYRRYRRRRHLRLAALRIKHLYPVTGPDALMFEVGACLL
jgi:hypothetical protein